MARITKKRTKKDVVIDVPVIHVEEEPKQVKEDPLLENPKVALDNVYLVNFSYITTSNGIVEDKILIVAGTVPEVFPKLYQYILGTLKDSSQITLTNVHVDFYRKAIDQFVVR